MKPGQKLSNETVQSIASDSQWERGRVSFEHLRCGLVVIVRKSLTAPWVVESVERPDP